MRKPLIPENQKDEHDLRNVYNPNKYQNHIGNYDKKDAKKEDKKAVLADNTKKTNSTSQVPVNQNATTVKNQTLPAKIDAKKSLAQISPMHPEGLVPPPPDYQYDSPLNAQLYRPLNRPNQVDANDLKTIYNPYKHLNHIGNYAQVNPAAPTGLEPAPKDQQYDVPLQIQKPLTHENRQDTNDLRNVYNPGKYENTLGVYSQQNAKALAQIKINPAAPTGLEPPPKDH